MALTENEKGDVLRHLGFAAGVSGSVSAAGPLLQELSFRVNVESALERVTPYGEAEIRILIADLDRVETNLRGARTRLAAQAVGSIRTNPTEPDDLEEEFRRWAWRLAELLGAAPNPFARRFCSAGVNVRRS